MELAPPISYFLDWRPIGGAPLVAHLPTRKREVLHEDIAPFVTEVRDTGRTWVPNSIAFLGARILARADGLYVMEIRLDPNATFYRNDLDELSSVVAMVAKAALGHVHYHHHLPGKGRPKLLKPTTTLMTVPIELDPRGWAAVFRRGTLSNRRLASAITSARKAPKGEPPRHAVACLRRAYLNLAEAANFRIVRHRQDQQSLGPFTWRAIPGLFVRGLGTSFFLAVVLRSNFPDSPNELQDTLHEMGKLPMLLASFLLTMAWAQWINIDSWHLPAVKLLRASHGYFTAVQPLNAIIRQLPLVGGNGANGDFQPTIDNFQSKLAGEESRLALQVTLLTVFVAVASFFIAIYEVSSSRSANAASPSSKMATSTVSNPAIRGAGPVAVPKLERRRPLPPNPAEPAPSTSPAPEKVAPVGTASSAPQGDATAGTVPSAPESAAASGAASSPGDRPAPVP